MSVYWGASRIAAQLGVATGTITKWIERYAATEKPFPAPDVEIAETDGRVTRGWSPRRWPEIEQWAQRRYMAKRSSGGTAYTDRLSGG
jgi:hypothetical protein